MKELNYSFDGFDSEAKIQEEKNNRENFLEHEWEFDSDRCETMMSLIHDTMSYAYPGFFGFKGEVDDTDVILYMDVSDFGTDCGELEANISAYSQNIKSISFTPHEGYFTIRVIIKDVFPKI